MSGQDIANELARRRGTKPTAGTIYPALKELKAKGLVEVRKKGRTTIYTLTEDGREGAKEACNYFCSAFGEIFREHSEVGSRQTR
jgi:PadR family transcriptional regulator PadR